ncbi:hypothetical protein LIER_25970 [Lithospermum erythrorhizon]|uniref:Uncharacterized protein n=1 Tax=Lithospermum erythrorhizon TaxID=34254 RepID=A0AAV3R6R1_LITER
MCNPCITSKRKTLPRHANVIADVALAWHLGDVADNCRPRGTATCRANPDRVRVESGRDGRTTVPLLIQPPHHHPQTPSRIFLITTPPPFYGGGITTPSRKSDGLLPTPFSHGGTTIRHYQSDGILPTPTDHLRRYNGAFSPQEPTLIALECFNSSDEWEIALLGQDLFHTDSTGSSDNSYGLSHDDSGMNHFYSKVSFNSVHNRDGSNQTEEIIEDLDPDPPTSETSTNCDDNDDGYWSSLDFLDMDVDKESEWSDGGGPKDEQFDQNKIFLDSSSSPDTKLRLISSSSSAEPHAISSLKRKKSETTVRTTL